MPPLGLATTMSTGPAVPPGVVQLIVVALGTLMDRARVPPTVTVAPASKFVPVMTSAVPPAAGPDTGVTVSGTGGGGTTGAGRRLRPDVQPHNAKMPATASNERTRTCVRCMTNPPRASQGRAAIGTANATDVPSRDESLASARSQGVCVRTRALTLRCGRIPVLS